jgi:hypothetical protein
MCLGDLIRIYKVIYSAVKMIVKRKYIYPEMLGRTYIQSTVHYHVFTQLYRVFSDRVSAIKCSLKYHECECPPWLIGSHKFIQQEIVELRTVCSWFLQYKPHTALPLLYCKCHMVIWKLNPSHIELKCKYQRCTM